MSLAESGVKLVAQGYTQYKKALQDISEAQKKAFDTKPIDNYNRAIQDMNTKTGQVTTKVQSTWNVVQNMRQAYEQAGQGANQAGGKFGSLAGILGTVAGAAGGVGAAVGLIMPKIQEFLSKLDLVGKIKQKWQEFLKFMSESGDVAQRNETLAITIQEIGTNAGYTTEQITTATEVLRKQGITTAVAQQSLIRMARANISWANAADLARLAQGAAVAAGMNSSEAFERLVLGIQKMEPELLDELGITLRRTDAYKRFADEMGLNASKLTDQQKQQAILNEVMRQGAGVMNVYDKAQETSGKQQGSLTRKIEEAKNVFGQLLLPIREVKVMIETMKWEGLYQVATGFKAWVPIIRAATDVLKEFFKTTKSEEKGHRSTWQRIGMTVQTFARVYVDALTIANVATYSWKKALTEVGSVLGPIGLAIGALATGNMPLLVASVQDLAPKLLAAKNSAQETFSEVLPKALADVRKKFPDVYAGWDDLQAKFDEGLDLNPETIEDDSADIQAELEEIGKAYKKLDDIQRKFADNIDDYNKDHTKAYLKLLADMDKQGKKAAKDFAKRQAALDKDEGKQRAKIIAEFNKDQAKQQKKRNDDLLREQERFNLQMAQAQRRFQVSDRRLRAEGDVLALMQLREDFELQQKEAKENFDLQQRQGQQQAQTQQQEELDGLQERLNDLKASTEERRQELTDSYNEELADQREANQERMDEFRESWQERLDTLIENRNKELEELGRSLNEEGKITEEGMKTIADKIREVFGEDSAGDALIQGWTERTTSAFGTLVADIEKQISGLNDGIVAMTQGLKTASAGGGPSIKEGYGGVAAKNLAMPQAIGMAGGGEGVVTGPKHFYVEPGVKEYVKFVPQNRSRHTLSGSVGLNVSGMPSGLNERLEGAIIDKAAERFVGDLEIAIQRMKRKLSS